MKKIFPVILCAFGLYGCSGSYYTPIHNYKRVAVMDFDGSEKTFNAGGRVSGFLRTGLIRRNYYEVIERDRVKDIINERKNIKSGQKHDKKMSELGNLMGVDAIIFGSISSCHVETFEGEQLVMEKLQEVTSSKSMRNIKIVKVGQPKKNKKSKNINALYFGSRKAINKAVKEEKGNEKSAEFQKNSQTSEEIIRLVENKSKNKKVESSEDKKVKDSSKKNESTGTENSNTVYKEKMKEKRTESNKEITGKDIGKHEKNVHKQEQKSEKKDAKERKKEDKKAQKEEHKGKGNDNTVYEEVKKEEKTEDNKEITEKNIEQSKKNVHKQEQKPEKTDAKERKKEDKQAEKKETKQSNTEEKAPPLDHGVIEQSKNSEKVSTKEVLISQKYMAKKGFLSANLRMVDVETGKILQSQNSSLSVIYVATSPAQAIYMPANSQILDSLATKISSNMLNSISPQAIGERRYILKGKDDRVKLGFKYAKSGLWQEAAMRWKSFLKSDPQNPYALNNLGVWLEKLGKNQDAVENYRKALGTSPENKYIMRNLYMVQKKIESLTP